MFIALIVIFTSACVPPPSADTIFSPSPDSIFYTSTGVITLNSLAGVTVCYTVDGSIPVHEQGVCGTGSSLAYTDSIRLSCHAEETDTSVLRKVSIVFEWVGSGGVNVLRSANYYLDCSEQLPDNDGDGVPDTTDNCPLISNPQQEDFDGDSLGDACDLDDDDDGVDDVVDNCPMNSNPSQQDTDNDEIGDACDVDGDNDGVDDDIDNCPSLFNPLQENNDDDGAGDVCDLDDDNDGTEDASDNCPMIRNPLQEDVDSDGAGDACDEDSDNDGIDDGLDNCPNTFNPLQEDADIDGIGDACDTDADNDGVDDESDNCPAIYNPLQEDVDNDSIGDVCDPDADEDGIDNAQDNCPLVANVNQSDIDEDGVGDSCDPNPTWGFIDVTSAAGFEYEHGYLIPEFDEEYEISGGVAAGDFNDDGYIDLYAVRGDIGPNLLFRNKGDGTFEEIGADAGVDITGSFGSGPLFADFDGDGFLDLLVNGVKDTIPTLFRNTGAGTFEDVTVSSALNITKPTFSGAFADYDKDGDLDLALTHWSVEVVDGESTEHLWLNDGDGHFTDVSIASQISATYPIYSPIFPDRNLDLTFTPNFSDINNDGWPDLLFSSDFGTSQILINKGDGTFADETPPEITDENGMGASVGDFNGDGDFDWFVTSIWDEDEVSEGTWGVTGNRLYQGDGQGGFEDVTDAAGVAEGYWGWGSCFADFNNDGNLDIFHVNGFSMSSDPTFINDPSRLFISNGDDTFTERSVELNLIDDGNGRGVVCFDYDRDGDIDVFVANNQGAPKLFRNNGGNANKYITVKLNGPSDNTQGIGAKITVVAGGKTQVQEIRAGGNFVSQNPAEAHFGVGNSDVVTIIVKWPNGLVSLPRIHTSGKVVTINHITEIF
ncbi:MAG: thrombospondin type 3 repeat-containing protein [Pseudomonadales bacterium]|nr:thrombospondin type 3 repeat-containing protein [Pseudomonadales bacterium]